MLEAGTIIKNISNLYVVSTDKGDYNCTPRGIFRHQKISPLVGDKVKINIDTNIIEEIEPRTVTSVRPPVANVENALIITSFKEPYISLSLLDRLIVIFESKNIKPILCFTKYDLLTEKKKNEYDELLSYYRKIGYEVFLNHQLDDIKSVLSKKMAFVVGQTGAGKSTLLNKLDNDLNIETKPISKALGRGVHTTRHSEAFKIADFFLIDTPGFSSVDFVDLKKEDIKNYFVEFSNYECEYRDCNHDKEVCEIKKAVLNNEILQSRYDNYLKFYKEIHESRSKLYK